jgi:hypothetical protein
MRLVPSLCAVILLAAGCGDTADAPSRYGADSREALLTGIREAAGAKDLQQYLLLTCWNRLPPHLQERFQKSVPLFMTKKVESVVLSADQADRIAGMADFKWNVDFRGYVEVRYEGMEEPVKLPYGELEGRFYLATTIKAEREF